MSLLPVVKIGHPVLRKKAKRVLLSQLRGQRFHRLLADMVDTMHHCQGVGLAANQVGHGLQAIVLECRSNSRYPRRREFDLEIYLNPRITKYSKKMHVDWEGCLSIPGYRGLVKRAAEVSLEAWDLNGKKVVKTFHGFHARVIQHEVDHLNGLFYMDRMINLTSWVSVEEFNRKFKTNVQDK